MFSKSRAFFFSTAVVFILLLIFFWVSTSLGLTTLEKFAFDLTQTSLFGYKIPQLFGAGLEGNQVEQVNLLKIVFTILILLFWFPIRISWLTRYLQQAVEALIQFFGVVYSYILDCPPLRYFR